MLFITSSYWASPGFEWRRFGIGATPSADFTINSPGGPTQVTKAARVTFIISTTPFASQTLPYKSRQCNDPAAGVGAFCIQESASSSPKIVFEINRMNLERIARGLDTY